VVITRMDADALAAAGPLLAHQARHASQFACCVGLPMIPAYFAAAAWSWALTADFGVWPSSVPWRDAVATAARPPRTPPA